MPSSEESQQLALVEDTTGEVAANTPTLELKPGCEKELQSLIADRMNDIVGTSVRRIPSIAIIGPNLLEFCVPINYDVDRKALDRPETVSRLESIVAELVGCPVRIQFRTSEAVQAATKPVTAAAAVSRGQIVDDPEDPYIQQITEVFGVKSWNVKEFVPDAVDEERTEVGPE